MLGVPSPLGTAPSCYPAWPWGGQHGVGNRIGLADVFLPFLCPLGPPRCLLTQAHGFLEDRCIPDPELPTLPVIAHRCPSYKSLLPLQLPDTQLCLGRGAIPFASALALASVVPLSSPDMQPCAH